MILRIDGAIAKYAIVTASSFYTVVNSATAQADGLVDRQPNGPGFVTTYAPQYVQLELPGVYNVTHVCLLVSQSPNGATHHQLSVGFSLNSTRLASDLNGYTQGCQIFRFLRKISAFRLFFRIFSAVPLFSAFREFFDALSINRFQETIRKKRIFLGKSMTITMQSLQNHWKEIDMENFLRRSRKDSTYQP